MLCQKISPDVCTVFLVWRVQKIQDFSDLIATQNGVNLLLSKFSKIPHENEKRIEPKTQPPPLPNQLPVADPGLLQAADLLKWRRTY